MATLRSSRVSIARYKLAKQFSRGISGRPKKRNHKFRGLYGLLARPLGLATQCIMCLS